MNFEKIRQKRIKSEINEIKENSDFILLDFDPDGTLPCKIEYNNKLYTVEYPKKYPFCEPIISITDLDTNKTSSFNFGIDKWTPLWSTKTLILAISTN